VIVPRRDGAHQCQDQGVSERRTIGSGGSYEDVYGYSRAVRVGAQVHVAGTCARGDDLDGDTYVQAAAALRIIGRALHDVGASTADVVRTVAYVTDIADADLVARAHREVFADVRPAATMVQVSALLDPRMRVEIEAYAVVGD
jgi:enamine deaminase RidA (YjgF/YER057c/UK114 family)